MKKSVPAQPLTQRGLGEAYRRLLLVLLALTSAQVHERSHMERLCNLFSGTIRTSSPLPPTLWLPSCDTRKTPAFAVNGATRCVPSENGSISVTLLLLSGDSNAVLCYAVLAVHSRIQEQSPEVTAK
uniref:Putative secreted protein n=1 Tax=Anopheles marajoara TaxID=58244 RepID=A0A2M4C711_9DIPT